MFNQPNYNKEKPPVLYRGVKIKYELLKNYKFIGEEMKPPYPPKIDEQGRKTVGDGNEYGVYMTDYDIVARNAYAAVDQRDGTPINKSVIFGNRRESTVIPSVGIVYKIKTDGLDVHVPWITSYLNGHYNNGMGGDEWIAESVPASNYSIDTVELGADTLHKSEMIDANDIELMKKELFEKIEKRKERLELFEKKIEEMPVNDRYRLDSIKIEVLKSIYRLDGIMDVNIDSFQPQTPSDYLKYLKAIAYSNNKENIDFDTLGYIQGLDGKLKAETTISDIVEMISNDMKNNDEKKKAFIERKEKSGEEYTTARFDRKNAMYLNLLNQLDTKINSKEKTGYDRKEDGTDFVETQEQVLTDYSGKEIGNRTITWNENIETGSRKIETVGTLENEDGIFAMKEITDGKGNEIQQQRKEIKKVNKNTGEKEQYVYQKEKDGREIYYRLSDGNLTFRIIKSKRGTEIFQYDKGQLVDSFEYDVDGTALIPMGEMESIDENFVENFFDAQVPYFEAENKEINHEKRNVSTQKLGKETVDIQKDVEKIDIVQSQIAEQMQEKSKQNFEINEFGEIIRSEEDNFRENLKFDVKTETDERVEEELRKFELGIEDEKQVKKKIENHKVEKGDGDYVR